MSSVKLKDTKYTSVVCLYTNNELSERKIRKHSHLTVAPKKYEGINLAKEVETCPQ